MATPRNNRKANRKTLDDPQIAVISYETKNKKILRFVNVMNLSVHGILIESGHDLKKDFELNLMILNVELNQWDTFFSRVAWVQVAEIELSFHVGLEFLFPIESSDEPSEEQTKQINNNFHHKVAPQDLNFILNTPLVNTLRNEDICSFLNCMDRIILDPGVRFLIQKETWDNLYIIQKGVCSIQIEHKDNKRHTVVQCREGDVIGEAALLTGRPSNASIISESDMILWQLSKDRYDRACISHPNIKNILTELFTTHIENSITTDLRNVGRYLMTHPIGGGDTGFIYKGKHKRLGMPVAIKMITHNLAMDAEFLDNFRRKGKRITKLNHPNIVQIYDINELYRTIFIVMEYLDGESLKTLLERKVRLPFSRVLSFLLQISAGLAHAHDHKIVHRDISPANIFIVNDDHIKLLDFGMACSQKEKAIYKTDRVHYMSPEQIKNNPVDHRSDIYSFGILAYELFTGKMPFADDNKKAMMNMYANTQVPDPKLLVPDLPDRVNALIIKACAKSPDKRYTSMNEIIEELNHISQSCKERPPTHSQVENEITVLLISHTINQTHSLNRLLDNFSQQAQKEGFTVKVTGKAQIP
ncbi:MAG: protein kinase [Desulfobacula sp.]|nr:protein kinase [Desulfobacula sp.]